MATWLRRMWAGEVPLARAFWDYAVLYGLLLNLAATGAAFAVFAADASTALGMAVFLLPFPYNLFVVVAVWRSAGRYPGPRHWADLARIAVIVWMLAVTLI